MDRVLKEVEGLGPDYDFLKAGIIAFLKKQEARVAHQREFHRRLIFLPRPKTQRDLCPRNKAQCSRPKDNPVIANKVAIRKLSPSVWLKGVQAPSRNLSKADMVWTKGDLDQSTEIIKIRVVPPMQVRYCHPRITVTSHQTAKLFGRFPK